LPYWVFDFESSDRHGRETKDQKAAGTHRVNRTSTVFRRLILQNPEGIRLLALAWNRGATKNNTGV
jgi:hypothetical protein